MLQKSQKDRNEYDILITSKGNKLNKFLIQEEIKMKKYVCDPCGWIYDPEVGDPDGGIAPGTAFEDIRSAALVRICSLRLKSNMDL